MIELKDVGHDQLNSDHMKIYQVIVKFNNLSKRFITNNEDDIIELCITMDSILSYIRNHFELEESLLEQTSYPDLELHMKKHDTIRDNVVKLRGRIFGSMSGCMNQEINLDALTEMNEFLLSWWVNHINKFDIQYKRYIEEN
jgi:hemerythrin-like metal-binding protein